MPEQEKTKQFRCANCQNRLRPHTILHEVTEPRLDDYNGDGDEILVATIFHRFIQCRGCDAYKYAVSGIDYTRHPEVERLWRMHPEATRKETGRERRIFQENDDSGNELIPENVWKMYGETVDAINANILTLAGGGLRATVEAICQHSGITRGSLENKIDELVTRQLLTAAQAKFLHAERSLGNEALHELLTPTADEIEEGLGIVEGLINTLYLLPEKAKRLDGMRAARKNKK